MTTKQDYVMKRLEIMEAEIQQLKALLSAQPVEQPLETSRGVWSHVEIPDEEVDEVTRYWQKRIDELDL